MWALSLMLPGAQGSRVPFLAEVDRWRNKPFWLTPCVPCFWKKKKLLGLGHCLLAASAAIRVRKVWNKGFYFIPFASLLASGFALQSLRGKFDALPRSHAESQETWLQIAPWPWGSPLTHKTDSNKHTKKRKDKLLCWVWRVRRWSPLVWRREESP